MSDENNATRLIEELEVGKVDEEVDEEDTEPPGGGNIQCSSRDVLLLPPKVVRSRIRSVNTNNFARFFKKQTEKITNFNGHEQLDYMINNKNTP